MWAKIKLGLAAASVLIVSILYGLFRSEKAKRKESEAVAKQYKDTALENATTIEAIKHANKIQTDISNLSDNDVTERLQQYNRSRKK